MLTMVHGIAIRNYYSIIQLFVDESIAVLRIGVNAVTLAVRCESGNRAIYRLEL
jgi:hypothetical protein